MDIAIVTGANSRIGLAISRKLIEIGCRVYGLGNDFTNYPLGNRDFIPVVCDLTDTEHLCKVVSEIVDREKNIYVLVNHARHVSFDEHEKQELNDLEHLVKTNLLAPLLLTRLALPSIIKMRGYIINIGFPDLPGSKHLGSSFLATETALREFSHRLYEEVRQDKVRVTSLIIDSAQAQDLFKEGYTERDNHDLIVCSEAVAQAVDYVVSQKRDSVISQLTVRPQKGEPTEEDKKSIRVIPAAKPYVPQGQPKPLSIGKLEKPKPKHAPAKKGPTSYMDMARAAAAEEEALKKIQGPEGVLERIDGEGPEEVELPDEQIQDRSVETEGEGEDRNRRRRRRRRGRGRGRSREDGEYAAQEPRSDDRPERREERSERREERPDRREDRGDRSERREDRGDRSERREDRGERRQGRDDRRDNRRERRPEHRSEGRLAAQSGEKQEVVAKVEPKREISEKPEGQSDQEGQEERRRRSRRRGRGRGRSGDRPYSEGSRPTEVAPHADRNASGAKPVERFSKPEPKPQQATPVKQEAPKPVVTEEKAPAKKAARKRVAKKAAVKPAEEAKPVAKPVSAEKPAIEKAPAKKAAVKKTAAKKAAVKKTAVKKVAAKKAPAKKVAAKKVAAKKTAAKKVAAKKTAKKAAKSSNDSPAS